MPQPDAEQFAGIFISYRRDDSAGHAGRLFDRLSEHFGDRQIFMDIDHIEPGEDFVEVIEDGVGSCEILITVIGRHWLMSADGAARRLDDPNDFVRLEVAAALRRNIRVIPVLVQGADMPRTHELPEDLSLLARRQAIELSDQRWKHDISRLIATLEKVLAEKERAKLRAAQEAEERQHQAEEEERRRLEEEEKKRKLEEAEALAAAARAAEEKREREAEEERQREARRRADELERKRLEAEESERQRLKDEAAERLKLAEAAAAEERRRLEEEEERRRLAEEEEARDRREAEELERRLAAARAAEQAAQTPPEPPAQTPSEPPAQTSSEPHERSTSEQSEQTPVQTLTADAHDETHAQSHAQWNEVTNRVSMALVWIPPAEFMMGSRAWVDEQPVHPVTIREGFYMGKHLVTQEQWRKVTGDSPSHFKGDDFPVEQVSWDDAQAFVLKLSEMDEEYEYRLPTEAEWEYACRAGTEGDYAGELDSMGWYGLNSGQAPHPVGLKSPNAFGLHDMHGNVWEWCQDNYSETYDGAPDDGSARACEGEPQYRVARGGAWYAAADLCRSAVRSRVKHDSRNNSGGLRVVATARH